MRDKFWATAKVKNVNGEARIQALVDKKVIITEASIRRDLRFEDEGGVDCLSNEVIFEQLTLMSSTMASAIICLATNQKFNFSKYIFDNMVKHLDGGVKFLMYLRFVKVFLDNQVEGMDRHNAIFVTFSHTKKVFANMKREGKDFSRKITPLFATMMKKQKSKRKHRKEIEVPSPSSKIPNEEGVPITSNDLLPSEEAKTAQAKEIANLKKKVKKLKQKRKSRTSWLKRLRKGRMNEEDMFGVNDVDGDEDELTLAQTLIKIKASKPKAITIATTIVTTAGTRPKAKGIVMQEPSERPTPTPIDYSQKPSQAKDKGKGKMVEPERPLKRKDHIMMDEEVAKNLEAQMQAELKEEERLARLKEEETNIALVVE
uniref:Uncharacterized protein n=1 Tax=Tanacetum cinerariifolium TaxID=118510 RepID=A0A6L2MYK6_TANCI|nr:hypothetical protein [Tanacetum cinerariifolium]